MKMLTFQQNTVNSQHHRPVQLGTLFHNRKPELVEHAGFQLHLVSKQPPTTASTEPHLHFAVLINPTPLLVHLKSTVPNNTTNSSLETTQSLSRCQHEEVSLYRPVVPWRR